MSKRGEVLLREIRSTGFAVLDVDRALARRPAPTQREALNHMRQVLARRLDRAQDLYWRHVRHTARRCGVPIR